MNFKQEPTKILSEDVIDLTEEFSQIDYETKFKTEDILEELKPEEIDIKKEPVHNFIEEHRSSPTPSNKNAFDKLEIFECAECGYTTTFKASLKSHVKFHSKVKPFACTLCDYKTVDKSNLRSHLRIHTGEKPHKCTYCDYKTTATSALKQHMAGHTGEQNYKCKFCSFKTRYRASFTIHVRKHTGEKPFKCSHCDYRSSCKKTVTDHIKIHTGERPYQCPHCKYKARVNKALKVHIKRMHKGDVNKANSSSAITTAEATQYYRDVSSCITNTTMLGNVHAQNNTAQMCNTDSSMFNTNVYDMFGFSLFDI